MVTIQLTNEQLNKINVNLDLVNMLLEGEPTPMERDLANTYCDLVKAIAGGVVADGTLIHVGQEEFVRDNVDHPERHNIAGSMNRPSTMQEKGYKKGDSE